MKIHVLLADDESTFRETLSKVLEEEGMDVTAVANGTDAIDAITTRPYDVAILDIQMPGADGIKVLRETVKVRPETRVIMITAYGTVEMAVEAINAEFDNSLNVELQEQQAEEKKEYKIQLIDYVNNL